MFCTFCVCLVHLPLETLVVEQKKKSLIFFIVGVVPKQQVMKYSELKTVSELISTMSSISSKHIHVETGYDTFDLNGYTCELSANSFVPPTRRTQPKERNFFNSHKEVNSYFINEKLIKRVLLLDKTIVNL